MLRAVNALRRALAVLPLCLALGVAGLAVAAPIARLAWSSVHVREIVTTSGRAYRVAGHVFAEPDGIRFQVAPAEDPDGERVGVRVRRADIAADRERLSLAHYGDVLRSSRTFGLVRNSLVLAGGAALFALLLGAPLGWLLARTRFAGRAFVLPFLVAPLLLPPFFAAMGVSSSVGAFLHGLGLTGGTLQLASAIVCLGGLLFPVPALLVGRALAAVPAGLVEAAHLLGGGATSRVVLPSALPAALASFVLVFVTALCDFAVPDLLGVFLPTGAVPVHVFATEIFLQWDKMGNERRAFATAAPFVVLVLALLGLALRWLRRCPEGFLGGATRARAPLRLSAAGQSAGWVLVAVAFGLGIVLPLSGVLSWGFVPSRVPATIRATDGVVGDAARWLRSGLLASIVATLTSIPLSTALLRGPRGVRIVVVALAGLSLAVPGMALMVGTLLLWLGVPTDPGTLWKPVLVLVGHFLPYAIVAGALAQREIDPRLADPARLLGASPATRFARIWAPLSARGWASAALIVLVFALRELDSVAILETKILPVRIYDKVHYGRTGQVADLSMAYLAALLVPAIALVALSRRRGSGGEAPRSAEADPGTGR